MHAMFNIQRIVGNSEVRLQFCWFLCRIKLKSKCFLISLVSEEHICFGPQSEVLKKRIRLTLSFLHMELFKLLHLASLASFMSRPTAIE